MDLTLCQQEHLLREDFAAYCALVVPPRYLCRECGRAAVRKTSLCTPQRLPSTADAPADETSGDS